MNSVQSDFTPWPEQMASDYRRLGLWQDKTLYQYLKQSIIRYPTNIAIVCGQQSITYAELERKIHAAANGFRSLGLSEGDNVILQMTNIAEFYISYFALIHQAFAQYWRYLPIVTLRLATSANMPKPKRI